MLGEAGLASADVENPDDLANKVASILENLARRDCPELIHACDPLCAPCIAREGRCLFAEALGHIPPSGTWREIASCGRPLPTDAGVRCPELDGPVLSEVCGLLHLDMGPSWPPVRTRGARARRLLAVGGALGRLSIMAHVGDGRSRDTDHKVAAWLLGGIVRLLLVAASSRFGCDFVGGGDVRAAPPHLRGAGRPYGNRPRSCAPGGAVPLGHSPLMPGDEVLAHWALPSGKRSNGVEDAVVLEVDPGRKLALLRYMDGLEVSVPAEWVVEHHRRQHKEYHRQRCDEESPSSASCSILGVVSADGADHALLRLIQRGAPSAEICARVRLLCARASGAGLEPLAVAVRAALPAAPEPHQLILMEVICALCGGGAEDASFARTFVNAVLLSGCDKLACTHRQRGLIQRSEVLTVTQKSKLEALFHRPRHMWLPFS
eukprot:TRINITY_DN15647_c0_g4_i1.p1 TRINITY_DN15647_c0_g4~~TRINITY_DN15647_c0_g4_i1.p1  ORF type:complete len:434 (+),score=46.70 TRINITY_DN15647_c0_g4_i1:67-1368(+)